MAELTHEHLWKVCQRKPGDYEPYGKRERLKGTTILGDCSRWVQVVPHPDWTRLLGLGRLRQFGESPCRAAHL
jgi:hypothetical protein